MKEIGKVEKLELAPNLNDKGDILSATINISNPGHLGIGNYFIIGGRVFRVTKIFFKKSSFLSTKSELYVIGVTGDTCATDFDLNLFYYDSKGKAYIK